MKFALQNHDPQPSVPDLDLTFSQVFDLLADFFDTNKPSETSNYIFFSFFGSTEIYWDFIQEFKLYIIHSNIADHFT